MTVPLSPILAATAIFLAAGVGLLALLSLIPATAASARALWPTLLAEFIILGAAAAAFAAGGAVLFSLMLVVAGRVSFEAMAVFSASSQAGSRAALAAGAAGVLLGLGAAWLKPEVLALAAVFILLVLLAAKGLRLLPVPFVDVALFPVLPAALMVGAAAQPQAAGLLLLLFGLIESYDSYALLGGKLFGRRRIFPRLSPNKTAEGIAVGAAALALTAAVVGAWLFGMAPAVSIPLGLAVGVLAVAGDLAASRLKRMAGVKDFPLVLPRQGGLLDIVDAWLLTGAVLSAALALSGNFPH